MYQEQDNQERSQALEKLKSLIKPYIYFRQVYLFSWITNNNLDPDLVFFGDFGKESYNFSKEFLEQFNENDSRNEIQEYLEHKHASDSFSHTFIFDLINLIETGKANTIKQAIEIYEPEYYFDTVIKPRHQSDIKSTSMFRSVSMLCELKWLGED